jgi:hypothetical protein
MMSFSQSKMTAGRVVEYALPGIRRPTIIGGPTARINKQAMNEGRREGIGFRRSVCYAFCHVTPRACPFDDDRVRYVGIPRFPGISFFQGRAWAQPHYWPLSPAIAEEFAEPEFMRQCRLRPQTAHVCSSPDVYTGLAPERFDDTEVFPRQE